jgi:hypothetical protein
VVWDLAPHGQLGSETDAYMCKRVTVKNKVTTSHIYIFIHPYMFPVRGINWVLLLLTVFLPAHMQAKTEFEGISWPFTTDLWWRRFPQSHWAHNRWVQWGTGVKTNAKGGADAQLGEKIWMWRPERATTSLQMRHSQNVCGTNFAVQPFAVQILLPSFSVISQ